MLTSCISGRFYQRLEKWREKAAFLRQAYTDVDVAKLGVANVDIATSATG
jgi:hypothetical protein